MDDWRERLGKTSAVIERGRDDGLHRGGQLYVSLDGEVVADAAFGEARPGEAMTRDHLLRWMSAVKPVLAVALAQLWEDGRLEMDDPVHRHIPGFEAAGKADVTLRHLLTHTAGLPELGREMAELSREAIFERLVSAGLQPDWVPGKKAGYSPTSGWFVLGEIVRRLTEVPYEDYARQRILLPLEMKDSWAGMSEKTYRDYGARIAAVEDTSEGEAVPLSWETDDLRTPSPGGSGRGPVRELGRFYEMLLNRGRLGKTVIVSPQSVEALTARHRVRMLDQTFGFVYDWGLGLMLDSKGNQGASQLAYDFGAHCSPRAFGHGGNQCATGFCDPQHRLVVAWAFNGLPGEARHRRRNHAVNTAIYEDLGLA
jgi:CubicO group peptidase (beta-lactamase class C family)